MRKFSMLAAALALSVGFWTIATTRATADDQGNDPRISLADQCDPATFPAGLCVATPHRVAVTFADFSALLFSPLIATVVGHPAWRLEPSFLEVRSGHTLRVTNTGGENHTFTEVAAFGGGFVPPLNGVGAAGKVPLTAAPECVPPPGTTIVGPGTSVQIKGLSPGVHTFQCCIHPWMRAAVTVE